MKKHLLIIIFFVSFNFLQAQNVGIGTTTPSATLEVKNPSKSTVKISSGDVQDTTRLIFSNRNEFIGSDMSITFLKEQGLYFSSSSLFPYNNSDSILFMTPSGYIGVNNLLPYERLDVRGRIRSDGGLINETGILEFGVGLNKQSDNGKIGLNVFGANNALSIVGGGVAPFGNDRRIKFWADSIAEFTGRGTFNGNVGIGVAPTAISLTLNSPNGGLLSLRNSNALSNGISSDIYFGGNNYTTGIIRTIGKSANNARMGFFTGYSFTGGANFLVERMTIANNGNIGINNNDPDAKLAVNGRTKLVQQTGDSAALEINGGLKVSGTNSFAFTLSALGNMLDQSLDPTTNSPIAKYVRIDHPLANNNPNAILMVTPINDAINMGVRYQTTSANTGYWHLRPSSFTRLVAFTATTLSAKPCDLLGCINVSPGGLISETLMYPSDKWNILIISR